jgi:predicted ATPase
MLLVSAEIGPFRSINKAQKLDVDPNITVIVGMNEAGKTVILQSLQKAADALGMASFDPVEDYPRRDLQQYLKRHASEPEKVITLTYALSDVAIAELNGTFHLKLERSFTFAVNSRYDNTREVILALDERPHIEHLAQNSNLSGAAAAAVQTATDLRSIPSALSNIQTTGEDKQFLRAIEARIAALPPEWSKRNVLEYEVWTWLEPRSPLFLYFGDYEVLPSKTNLADLAVRAETPALLNSEARGVLALLRMADIAIGDLSNPGGYEALRAKIEGVSINLTDQIMEFWKQNENLEVAVDIMPDPHDEPPFNNGANLYLRIRNTRHRGISTPFRQRSRGFIWFFSFLVWFDSVKHQFAATENSPERPHILLLDEPGLSLHALAQSDFLNYIDSLGKKHQVLYSTHSPFMVNPDRLLQVRIVEDRPKVGTTISTHLESADPRTIFPLQAALGWTVAQNLFAGDKNLLVEGPGDLVLLQMMSGVLEAAERTALDEDVVIVPAGGLEKVATFAALLGTSDLKLAVLHDYDGLPDQRLSDLVREKMISKRAILNAAQFRDLHSPGVAVRPGDLEDLFPPGLYLQCFNNVYAKKLQGAIDRSLLPVGDRVVQRIERYLEANRIALRPSGGFNHYLVAAELARNPPAEFDADTLKRFEGLFKAINELY